MFSDNTKSIKYVRQRFSALAVITVPLNNAIQYSFFKNAKQVRTLEKLSETETSV